MVRRVQVTFAESEVCSYEVQNALSEIQYALCGFANSSREIQAKTSRNIDVISEFKTFQVSFQTNARSMITWAIRLN